MTGKWLLEDIDKRMHYRNRVVLLDPKAACGFVPPLIT
jgi:hypothetical protein